MRFFVQLIFKRFLYPKDIFMDLMTHFIIGFLVAFIGSIPPSMLNMTALKTRLNTNAKEAKKIHFRGFYSGSFANLYSRVFVQICVGKTQQY